MYRTTEVGIHVYTSIYYLLQIHPFFFQDGLYICVIFVCEKIRLYGNL